MTFCSVSVRVGMTVHRKMSFLENSNLSDFAKFLTTTIGGTV